VLYDEPVMFVKGLTLFRDFSEPRTMYYLPREAPRIARSAEGGENGDYAMRLVLYRPDPNAPPPQGMENGGGFLNLDTDLHVNEAVLEEVKEEVSRKFGADVNLVPVPFMRGSVELVLLGQTRDDTNQPFVRKIAGSTVPSLYGNQRAAFSVVLDRDGAALMKQVIEEGGATMAAAIYHLTYAGIGPAYNLKITIDYERVFEHLDLRVRAGVNAHNSNVSLVAKAGFHMLMEELREKRAIKVEEVDPIPGENGRTPTNQEMINEIIGNLMGSKWFKPTLAQGAQIADLGAAASSGSSGSGSSGGTTSTPGTGGTTPPTGTTQPGATQPGTTQPGTTGTAAATRKAASWTEDSRTPPGNFPPDIGVDPPTPSTSGTQETIVVRGAGAVARAGDTPATLAPIQLRENRLVLEVPPGQTKHVEISWPAVTEERETFHLFFDYERPRDANDVGGYSAGTPSPAETDPRFLPESRAPSGTGRGPTGLQAWLDSLASRDVELHAHASFEQDDSVAKQASNQALSERRLAVAQALIPSGFNDSNAHAHGHTMAKANTVSTLTSDGGPVNSRGGKAQHRVVTIAGLKRAGATPRVFKGHWTRPPNDTIPPPPPPPPPEQKKDPMKVEASFEINLEMIQREERIVATYELNTRKARTQEVHPQGQLILEAIDPSRYVLEADGAIDFFQWLDIEASTTAQWELEGIDSITVQFRYAPRGDGGFLRSGEVQLTKNQATGAWRTGVLHENDDEDLAVVYWYDYRVTVHYLSDVALGNQQGAVTSVGAKDADPDGWIRSESRHLVIHPRDVTPAITVNVASGIMHFDLLERAHLVVSYGPYRQNIALSAEDPEHRFVIRPEPQLMGMPLRTEGTLFYKDGAQVPLSPQEWTPQELIVINEPRENMLRVRVMLADPMKEYQQVSVRLKYEHGERLVERVIDLKQHAQLEEWAVRLEDPAQRAWQYQFTAVKRSGDIDTSDWLDGEDDQLILGVKAADVIPVEVSWLVVPPASDLLAVRVEMRYLTDRDEVQWQHTEVIRAGHAGNFTWSIPITDLTRRSYQYRVTEFRASGASEGQWQTSDVRALILLPGN
jgi:hypothetical protein